MSTMFSLTRSDTPLVISIPHLGSVIPTSLRDNYTEIALSVADTDWHLDRLYDCVGHLNPTIIAGRMSRYVIDLNRPPNDESLYPGQTTTGLCPTESFRGEAVYRDGKLPDAAIKQARVEQYWRPYHEALAAELARLRAMHPRVMLWEAHSIASVLPRLFEDKLPDLNLGTQDGRTAAPAILAAAAKAAGESRFTTISNGRFKGGYITRNYGAPEKGIHAIQLEMCQSTYMDENYPFDYLPQTARQVQPVLNAMVSGAYEAMLSL